MVICGYCNRAAERVTGKVIYPHRPDLYEKVIYRCEPCGAYVGCHPGTDKPLGRLATAELRRAKMAAHAAFDPIWKSKTVKRGSAYRWMADQLGIAHSDCHIGEFDESTCNRVVQIVSAEMRKPKAQRFLKPDGSQRTQTP
jgi:hypothetical protein